MKSYFRSELPWVIKAHKSCTSLNVFELYWVPQVILTPLPFWQVIKFTAIPHQAMHQGVVTVVESWVGKLGRWGGENNINILNVYKEDCSWAHGLGVTFPLGWLFILYFRPVFYNDGKLISAVTEPNWFNFQGQALLVLTPSSFTRRQPSWWMAWGWFSLAWLEYSH